MNLEFSARFFMISLMILFLTAFSASYIDRLSLKNTFLLVNPPQIFFEEPSKHEVSLSLIGTETYKQSEQISAFVIMNSGTKSVQSADVVIEYDPSFIEFRQVNPANMFSEPIPAINKLNRIYFSLIAADEKSFSGQGELAELLFTAKQVGSSELKIIHQKGDTTDSNIVLQASTTDSLNSVSHLKINIIP